MAKSDTKKTSVKRKHTEKEDDAPVESTALKLSGLEMLTDDEDDEYDPDAESDGGVDEFPEIDADSDSDEDEGEEDEDFSGEEDEEDEEESSSEDSELESDYHVGPRAKTVISGITGQPKKVYPEIEPDYDSDSSTEDVCANQLIYKSSVDISSQGDQPSGQCADALVRRYAAHWLRCQWKEGPSSCYRRRAGQVPRDR